MNPPEDPGVFTWLADKAVYVCTALFGVLWKVNDAAHTKTREDAAAALTQHSNADASRFQRLEEEQAIQRGHIGKLFDKLEAQSLRAEDRHNELLTALHSGLNQKADK